MSLPYYLSLVQPYIDQYGYAAVFAGILLEDFGVPAPGEGLLIAGALLASQNRMHIGIVLAVACTAAVIGDNIGYAIGRFGGRKLVLRFGLYVHVRPHHLERVERFVTRFGSGIVIVARFVQVLRQLNGVVAGFGQMPWWRFLAFNVTGAALWVGAWGAGVYVLGRHMELVTRLLLHRGSYLIAALVVAAMSLVLLTLEVRRRNHKASRDTQS